MGKAIEIMFLGLGSILGVGLIGNYLTELTGLEFFGYLVMFPLIAFVLYLFWIIVLN